MSTPSSYDRLHALLREVGIRTIDDRHEDGTSGYPLSVPLKDGGSLVLDLPSPAFLTNLDAQELGVAVLDPLGYPKTSWGLALRIPFLRFGTNVLESPIAGLLEGAFQGGHGSLYLDGYRYFSSGMAAELGGDVFILVVNAQDERHARRQASKSWRTANALKCLGKALTMNQTMQPLCNAAAHEIASSCELAAVLIWTLDQETEALQLLASVGANRLGTAALNRLSIDNASGCAAELVAVNRQPFQVANVLDHILTSQLEAKFCYLKPGGVSVHALENSGKLLGVVELIGREGDPYFQENAELFETIAEHLALALNGASMFENFELLASHDALTGLANHRYMQEFLHHRLVESSRTGQGLGVIMIDVDHFRSFNEEEGHDAGDLVLRRVGEALKSCVRPYDLAARYGGEEFTVIMPGGTRESTLILAERIRETVEMEPFVTKGGRVVHVTISAGCAVFPEGATDAPGLLKVADIALFEAKRAGRNRVEYSEGHVSGPVQASGVSTELLQPWIHPIDWQEGERRLLRLTPDMDALALQLRLSDSQRSILEALTRVVPTYRRARQEEDLEFLESATKAPEFRLLLPSLLKIDERFDGKGPQGTPGPRIPLLARVIQVLFALEQDLNLYEDAGRFDPQIVGLVTDFHRAA